MQYSVSRRREFSLHYQQTPISEKDLIVVYRELGPLDGFVVTTFMTSRVEKLLRRGIIWQR